MELETDASELGVVAGVPLVEGTLDVSMGAAEATAAGVLSLFMELTTAALKLPKLGTNSAALTFSVENFVDISEFS